MKSLEMLNALAKNEKLKFICKDGTIAEIGNNGCLKLKDALGSQGEIRMVDTETHLIDEWKLVREPVDFMTAINSGKNIKPVTGYFIFADPRRWLKNFLYLDIVNGKWDIEE